MSTAKYVGRVGALAVALGVGVAVATTPALASAEFTDSSKCSSSDLSSSDSTALVMDDPSQDIDYCTVTTPEQVWPITGDLLSPLTVAWLSTPPVAVATLPAPWAFAIEPFPSARRVI